MSDSSPSVQLYQGVVEKLVYSGDGLIRKPIESDSHGVAFIPETVPGETVEYSLTEKKKKYARGTVKRIVSPSPMRTIPKCAHFGLCGGCQLQHIQYACHGEIKRGWLQEAFSQMGAFNPQEIIWESAKDEIWHWRKKITLHAFFQDESWHLGYYAARNARQEKRRNLFPIHECPIFLHETETYLVRDIQDMLNLLFIDTSYREEGIVLDVSLIRSFRSTSSLPSAHFGLHISLRSDTTQTKFQGDIDSLIPSLKKYVHALDWVEQASFHFFTRTGNIKGTPYSQAQIGSHNLRLPHHIFSQNHPTMSLQVWRDVAELIKNRITHMSSLGKTCFLECYSGIGAVSLLVQEAFPNIDFHAIEVSRDACRVFEEAISKNPDTVYRVYPMTVEKALESQEMTRRLLGSKNIIWSVNPPREGISSYVRDRLVTGEFGEWGVYTSCNPATLQRDIRDFIAAGWKIVHVKGYDLFPMTTHFESVVVLQKQ